MESDPVNLPPSNGADDSRFDAWLKQAAPPISDQGFSQRVLNALPPKRPRNETAPRSSKWILCTTAGLLGSSVAFFQISREGGLATLAVLFESLGTINEGAFQQGAMPLQVALLTTACSLAYVYRRRFGFR